MLPKLAIDIVRAPQQLGDSPYVLAGRGVQQAKRTAVELPDVPQWQLYDPLRTARSLMSRAGVSSEHAERVMGHAIKGVEGVYDVHEYRDERADALARLAALVDTIVYPQPANVVPMLRKRK